MSKAIQIYRDVREANLTGPTFLTIGNFDGLHRGHQALIAQLQRAAAEGGRPDACTALITFEPHPLKLFRPEMPLQLLTSPQERVELAGALGVDIGIIHPFDRQTAGLSPRDFMQMLVDHLGLAALVVGPDFALGRNRAGTLDVLAQLGEELGYRVIVIDPVVCQGEEVRSLAVREHLQTGDVVRAAKLLGRPYSAPGVVIPGDRRGRTIGVPTANLDTPADRMLPTDGVYATWTWLGKPGDAPRFASATNIGVRPTVDGTHRRVETHLFDFPPPGESGDLYGRELTVQFVEWLRGEQRFENFDALVVQIKSDLVRARQILQN
ncbi:MAG: bifunctional riboflavin kinase/FAD synthetase [Caldilineaceae bacterium]|nr:bifunctional riboflavin kinase/FAD synthetase [Caldilineaceae bacterium]